MKHRHFNGFTGCVKLSEAEEKKTGADYFRPESEDEQEIEYFPGATDAVFVESVPQQYLLSFGYFFTEGEKKRHGKCHKAQATELYQHKNNGFTEKSEA